MSCAASPCCSAFVNARIFLEAVQNADGVKATVAGNLNRKFVGEMLEALRLPSDYIASVKAVVRVIDERDVFPLHVLRVVLELAGLIEMTKGTLLVTKQGNELMKDEQAGMLYALLFRSFFRELDLSYLDRFPEMPLLQETIAYSLFMASGLLDDWKRVEDIVESLFLPEVLEEIEDEVGREHIPHLGHYRILKPLMEFGPLEQRAETGESVGLVEVRKTELFGKFIGFELGLGLRLV